MDVQWVGCFSDLACRTVRWKTAPPNPTTANQKYLAGPPRSRFDSGLAGLGVVMRTIRESSPLWVWLALGLMALGTVGYGIAVFITEYLLSLS
jgi:hypothetical protein